MSHTSNIAQKWVFQQVLWHFYQKEHYLHDIGTEELAHLEMVGALVHQLTKNATSSEIEHSPFAAYFIDHGKGVWPTSAAGQAFTSMSFAVKGDPITDLVEDLAADATIL